MRFLKRERFPSVVRFCIFLVFSGFGECAKLRKWLGPNTFMSGTPPSQRWLHGFAAANGKLFLFGGMAVSGDALGDLHSFNPASMVWTRLSDYASGPAPRPRFYHGFAEAAGLLYVIGGMKDFFGGILQDMYSFDPRTLEWVDLTADVAGGIPQFSYSSVLASAQGMLYVADSTYDFELFQSVNTLLRYDPAVREWTDISGHTSGDAPSPRVAPALTSAGGALFLFGGTGTNEYKALGDLYRLEISTLTWSNLTAAVRGTVRPAARDGAGFVHHSGMLYMLGSSSQISLRTGSGEEYLSRVAATDDAVFTCGAFDLQNSGPGSGAMMRRLDIATLTWTDFGGQVQGTIPSRRLAHGFVSVDGSIFMFGGESTQGGDRLGDLQQLEAASLTWSDLTNVASGPLPVARSFHGLTATQGKLFIFGGSIASGSNDTDSLLLRDLFQYDIALRRWTDLSTSVVGTRPSAREGAGFTSLGSALYMFGGRTDTGLMNDLYRFDTKSLSWTDLSKSTVGWTPPARQFFGFVGAGRKLYMLSGTSEATILQDLWSLDVPKLVWTDLSQMTTGVRPSARMAAGITTGAGKLFVLAGFDSQYNFLNDLYALDLSTLEWEDIGSQISTSPPFQQPKAFPGLSYLDGMLYSFGGYVRGGTRNDLLSIAIAAQIQWPENGGRESLIEFFDWDTLVLTISSTMQLSWHLGLCSGYYPCALNIAGNGGTISRLGSGSFNCVSSAGCSGMSLKSVLILCDYEFSEYSFLEASGVRIEIVNSTFVGCSSETNGGVVYAHNGATVDTIGSTFKLAQSLGSGGAIHVVGSALMLQSTNFDNCWSLDGGGALSVSENQCSQAGQDENVVVSIDSCSFYKCTTGGSGGAISATGITAHMEVRQSAFTKCTALSSGGAMLISAATVDIINSSFRNNSAFATGGGAIYSANAELTLQQLACSENSAPNGGGGVLFWSGYEPTIVQWCDAGSEHSLVMKCTPSDCEPTCRPCGPGSYQTSEGSASCSLCESGKYSTAVGATAAETCVPCKTGAYSNASGASTSGTCIACNAGEYSNTDGASRCTLCAPGSYSSLIGADSSSSCELCSSGSFSSASGARELAACSLCAAGSFSPVSGSSACTNCRTGSYSTALGATTVTACRKCSAGTYAASTGSSGCSVCSTTDLQDPSTSICSPGDLMSCGVDSNFCLFTCDQGSIRSHPSELNMGSYYDVTWFIVPDEAIYVNVSVSVTKCCSRVEVKDCGNMGCTQIANLSNSEYGAVTVLGQNTILIDFFVANASLESIWSVEWKTERTGATHCSTCISQNGSNCANATNESHASMVNTDTPIRMRGKTAQFLEWRDSRQPMWLGLNFTPFIGGKSEEPHIGEDESSIKILDDRSATPNLSKQRETDVLHKEPDFAPHATSLSSRAFMRHHQTHPIQYRTGSVIDQARNVKAPAARKLHSSTDRNPRRQFCGPENAAMYGPCLATPYDRLEVLGWPTSSNPAYCGVPFELQLLKKDIYNQIVGTDNSSMLQTLSSLGGQSLADPYVSVSGSSVASLQGGRAVVSCVVKPSFSRLIASEGRTDFASQPYIYFKGIDSETLVPMDITPVLVHLSNGTAVCPPGYILVLEKTVNDVARQGTCSECGTGTYSVNPLAGITLSTPSCFNCPTKAICSGGMSVRFSLGTWRILGGMYRLVGCPPAYQLVNSIQGVFSHDIQQCVACQSNQYVLDSNNSNFTCQTCPAGAVCDGNNLTPVVAGSIWEGDATKGQYLLVSCPPGYERKADTHESQTCDRCPLSYYCLGGTAPSTACPSGTFAPAGSNASSACFAVVFVSVSISLPMSRSEFNATLQQKFREALAAASGVDVGRVVIESITQARRSAIYWEPCDLHQAVDICTSFSIKSRSVLDLSSDSLQAVVNGEQSVSQQDDAFVVRMRRVVTGSIQVSSKVAAESSDSAVALSSRLNTAAVNALLVSRGLPEGSVQSVAVLSPAAQGGGGTPVALIAGVAAGGFTVLVLMSVGGYSLSRKLRVQAAHRAFLNAFRSAKAGDKATPQHLPYALRKFYVPQQILGRGAFGVVVQAKTKQGGQGVAIKIVVPEKGTFEDRDVRQLRREAMVLDTFTQNLIDTAVHLVGSEAVHIQPEMCWFVMELLLGDNMEAVIKDPDQGPISDMECIKVARNILAALKIMHADGLVHRDIKPANIMRCARKNSGEAGQGTMFTYSLVDFGTALGVDETVARETMMTLAHNRNMGAGTQPYMSPEMFKAPDTAKYPTDIWSLGVTLFELVTGRLPFEAESDLLWSVAVAGNMSEKAPYVLDMLGEDRRSKFDNSLAKVIAKSLEKRVEDRYQSVDEMHEAVYQCLIVRGEATYSVFISYRVGSEAPFARLLFDELNHSVTPAGNRVTVYWDAHRLVKGEDWEEGFATGLLNSLCFFPLMSYGATAPLSALPPPPQRDELLTAGWDEAPLNRSRLQGAADDAEDNVLKEYLIAEALLERRAALERQPSERGAKERGLLQLAYPVLIGRQHPKGHPDYPRMGSFFQVQGGGGKYPSKSSPPTNDSVVRFLRDRAGANEATLSKVRDRTVASTVSGMTALQGCQMWAHPPDLEPADLTKEQRALVGKGYAGPAVVLGDGDAGVLTEEQRRELAGCGLDEAQLRMLKAEIRFRRSDFHEIIDRAVSARAHAEERDGAFASRLRDSEASVVEEGVPGASTGVDGLLARVGAGVTVTSEPGPMWVDASLVGLQGAVHRTRQ